MHKNISGPVHKHEPLYQDLNSQYPKLLYNLIAQSYGLDDESKNSEFVPIGTPIFPEYTDDTGHEAIRQAI